MSILIANTYVAILARRLRRVHPEVTVAAFLDDRNLTAALVETLGRAIKSVRTFDQIAGHFTNMTKSNLFATQKKDREHLSKASLDLDGERPGAVSDAKMVGHTVNTRRKHVCANLNQRVDSTAKRARRIENAKLPRACKYRLIATAAIPASLCGSLWELPSQVKMNMTRAAVVAALWGRKRAQ